jgi:heme exporter protein A
MLEVLNLGCVRGTRRLFKGLNFVAKAGELVEVRGPNGSGKTSLLRIVCGLAAPAEGEVRWQGKIIRSLGEEYFAAIAYVAHQNGVKDELSALENLHISARVAGNNISKNEAEAILERIGLGNQSHLPARLLSAGQRRRVALARLPASGATLWILDEVLTSLDDAAVELARQLIGNHLNKGGMAIVATHQDLGVSAGSVQPITLA